MRAAAALLMLATGGAALASGTIEIDPKFENFDSRPACEQALKRRHEAALLRLAALSDEERRNSRVEALVRNGEEQLTYFEVLDLTVDTPEIRMPRSQTERFTCRGSQLEHRVDYEAGGYYPGGPPLPPAQEKSKP